MPLATYLVEDEPLIRDSLLVAMEEMAEARIVGTAATQADASAWFSNHPGEWDLAVIDLFLAQGSGFDLLAGLANPHRRQQVVVLTNSATRENRAHCLRLGADAVFDKSRELEPFFAYCRKIAALLPTPAR